MRWKFALLDYDVDLPDRFDGTAEEALCHSRTIPLQESKHIIVASDEPLATPPAYPPGWFVRQVRKEPDSDFYHVAEDGYDHGLYQRRADWLVSYFVHRLKATQPCVFEIYQRDGRLLQVVIAEDRP